MIVLQVQVIYFCDVISFSDEVMQAVRNHDPSGRAQYDKICERMNIVPVSYFTRHILDNEITMRWHGLGPAAAKAIALVLRVGNYVTIHDVNHEFPCLF